MDKERVRPEIDSTPVPLATPVAAPRGRVAILRPLRIRDFAFLWTGMTVSLIGDGIYYVALPWQVYELSNAPTALSLVGVAWTLPMVVFLLLGGVISDRFDRRRVMIAGDIIRFVAIMTIGMLAVTGNVRLGHLFILVAIYGVGDALFNPAFGAIVPDIVPTELLTEANSLDQFVRPFALQMVGPALGGFAVHALGTGGAFLLDGATFVVSAAAIWLMRARPKRAERSETASVLGDVADGLRFVRRTPWLWGTLLAAAVALLVFFGPFEVLVPFLVKEQMGGSARDLGLIYALGGAGAVVAAAAVGQHGLPRKHILFMYLCWAISPLAIVGFGVATAIWQLAVMNIIMQTLNTSAMVVWGTLMHRLVPRAMLGRVVSLDWLVSIALVPVSFALTGPVAALLGVESTLIWAGLLGSISVFVFLVAIKGLRDTETDGSVHPL